MRHWLCLLVLTLSAGSAVAQTPHGIELGDLNRTVQPCTDFFEYANGGWRATNPIPASMPRWSRRWAAGEQAKEQLKVILDEATAMPNQPMGSIDRAKLNVNGSSVAIGHPFAATGTRIVAQLAKQLSESATARRGLISVCTAGGMGVVAILEKA